MQKLHNSDLLGAKITKTQFIGCKNYITQIYWMQKLHNSDLLDAKITYRKCSNRVPWRSIFRLQNFGNFYLGPHLCNPFKRVAVY
jgi:hypothetical protein